MTTHVNAYNLHPDFPNDTREFEIEIPNKCPHCSTAYSLIPRYSSYFIDNFKQIRLYSVFFCPSCENAFFADYECHEEYFGEYSSHYYVLYPSPKSTKSFSNALSSLSPKFVKIYHQAEIAENSKLKELCGMGYRKALEFLIKDYAISKHPEAQEDIEKSSLSKCIDDFINDNKFKTLAKAATWLGNDETHYVKKHENYNVQDMKRFLNAAIAFVEYELTCDEAAGFVTNS